jgi:hypothetical protein
LAPEFDLLQVSQGVMEKFNITVNPEHVKSHQDNTQAYKDLPWQTQLDCDCDQLAGSSWTCKQCKDTLHKIYAPPTGHIASLDIAGKFISSHIASAIKEASYCKDLTQYITNQSGWQNTDTFYSIDWESRSRAGKLGPPGQRLTLFKLEFALFATMSRRHRMEQAIDHRCPRCQKFQETLAHVFQCPSAVELQRKALIKAQATIWKKPSCKFVVTTLVSGISQWSTGAQVQWSGPIPGPADDIGTLAFKAFQEQQDIGWDQAIRGRLSKTWGEANMLYCTTCLNQGYTIQAAWSAHLVKSLWQYGIDQWIARNEYIYGKTKEEQVEKKSQEINKQIKVMHRADKFRVRGMDRHLFTLSLKKRLEQSFDRKQKWVECVTIAYEAWMEQKETQTSTCLQRTLNQSKNGGRRPQVRLRPTR